MSDPGPSKTEREATRASPTTEATGGDAADVDAPVAADAVAADSRAAADEAAKPAADVPQEPLEGATTAPSVEDLVVDLERVVAERDEYLDLARAKQAEFENYKKRVMKQQADHLAQATAGLVGELLPVLDALDSGVAHGDESLAPVRSQLLGVLEKGGLGRIDPTGESFDPTEHEAVAHEPGDGEEAVVAETLRAGYRWSGRLLRPAMVRVKG